MDGAAAAKRELLPVPEGTVIAGNYRVVRVLASGGMGVVAEGRHEALDQRVAIKFLRPEAASQGEAVQRFLREARAAAKIESDHVVRVFDVGMHGGIPYMVMEYLVGSDLDVHMSSGPLSVARAVDVVVQALDGLTQAHVLGIVHRDLKPANLFVVERSDRRSRRVKILDFGISKLMPEASRVETGLTSTRTLLGSPGYMSPEQVRSTKNVDERTDIWSMGVIFYELLTGVPAFTGETLGDVFAKIREEPLTPIRQLRPDVPLGLESVIMRCLAVDRNRRYLNAGELLEALAPFTGGAPALDLAETSPAPMPRVASAMSNVDAPTLIAEPGGNPPRGKSSTQATWSGGVARPAKRWTMGGVIGLGVAGLIVGIWAIRHSMTGGAPAEPSARLPDTTPPYTAANPPSGFDVRHLEAAPSVPVGAAGTTASASVPPRASAPSRRVAPAPSASVPIATPPAPPASATKKEDLGI